MDLDYLGLLGMALILIAWLPETWQNYKEKGKNLNLKFVLLYLFGSAFLTYHAYLLNDMVFLALNAIATLIAIINGYLILANRSGKTKIKKAKKKRK